MKSSVIQVGCPEARIDENVAKLTAAGYKASLPQHLHASSSCMRWTFYSKAGLQLWYRDWHRDWLVTLSHN